MDAKKIVASYFFAQAAGTAAWWLLLVLYPSSINWFQPADWPGSHKALPSDGCWAATP